MAFVVAIIVSVAVGLARGGRLAGLAALSFRRPWLLLAGVLIWLAIGPLPWQLWLRLAAIAPLLQLLAHVLLLGFIWENRHIPWLVVIGLGLLSNFVVMAANGGQIPVDVALIEAMGSEEETRLLLEQGYWVHSFAATPGSRLGFLGDVLFLGPPFPWPRVLSPGDVVIALGAFLVVQAAMLGKLPRTERRPGGAVTESRSGL
jgi:hypothetical protein